MGRGKTPKQRRGFCAVCDDVTTWVQGVDTRGFRDALVAQCVNCRRKLVQGAAR